MNALDENKMIDTLFEWNCWLYERKLENERSA